MSNLYIDSIGNLKSKGNYKSSSSIIGVCTYQFNKIDYYYYVDESGTLWQTK